MSDRPGPPHVGEVAHRASDPPRAPRTPRAPVDTALDAAHFPRVAAYLRGLPHGMASYPEAMVKASMYRDAVVDRPLSDVVDKLPGAMADLVERPPLVSTWISSVPVQALFLAIADHHRMTEEAFAAWTHRTQKSLLGGRLYRALIALASPTMLLNGTRVRWGSFHRGSEIEVVQTGPGEARLSVLFPRGLFATTNLRGFSGGFQAIAELSNAKPVSVTLVDAKPTRGDFIVRWREASSASAT